MSGKINRVKKRMRILACFPPVAFLWKKMKRIYGIGHKGFTAAKALIFYLKWLLVMRKRMYHDLFIECRATNIKPYKPLRWKLGSCYFNAKINGEDVFIKTGGRIDTTERERGALEYIREKSPFLEKHTPYIFKTSKYIVEKRVQGNSLKTFNEKNKELQNYCVSQLFEIYNELKKHNILHLDIRPDNFIIQDDNNLILIDFGYALVDNTDVYSMIGKNEFNSSVLKKLGSSFALGNGFLDDAYSFYLTMKYICPQLMLYNYDIWRSINEDIGLRKIRIS